MKSISFLSISMLCLFFSLAAIVPAEAQSKPSPVKAGDQSVSLKVYGVCGQCKERIETTALDVKGVKKAEWDIQTDMLALVGTKKMDKQKVATALAKAGHKSELAAADPKGYQNLPECCQYDSGIKKH